MRDRYAHIQENLILFEEEKKQRMKNLWYRLRVDIYKFNKWLKSAIKLQGTP
jgi:hypothetical protein